VSSERSAAKVLIMIEPHTLEIFILIAGIGQILLALASLSVPRILNWKDEVTRLRPLTRQVFWTYAFYILMCNLSFGILSAFKSKSLSDKSDLAACVTGFIAFYWLTRIVIQFFFFDRTDMPKGRLYTLAEVALVAGFIFFFATYCIVFYYNLQ
jgi:hypothetical protein